MTNIVPLTADNASTAYDIHCQEHPNPWSLKAFCDCLTAPYQGYALVDNDHSLGFAILLYVLDEATLMDIAVSDSERGKGFGKALLKYCVADCRERGMASLWLEVRATNEVAKQLYTGFGFELIEQRKNYYLSLDGQGREDALIMRLLF